MAHAYTASAISTDTAVQLVQVALQKGRTEGVLVSVAVVSPSLAMTAFASDNGATPHSTETSKRKAMTAASTGKPTGWMDSDLAIALSMGSGNVLTNIRGGLPIERQGELLGGIGIAGGTVEQDDQIAQETLQEFFQILFT